VNSTANDIHAEMLKELDSTDYGRSIIDNLFSDTIILSEHVLRFAEQVSFTKWSRDNSNEHTIHFLCVKLLRSEKMNSWIEQHGDVGVVIIQMIGNHIRTDPNGFRVTINSSLDPTMDQMIDVRVFPHVTYTLEFGRSVWNALAKPLLPSGVHLWHQVPSAIRNGVNVSVSELYPPF